MSVQAALEGVVHTLKSERNMRIHFAVGFLVLIAGAYFNLSGIEFLLLAFAVSFVLVTEMINTVVEHTLDFLDEGYSRGVKVVKDMAAGAVFVSSVNALLVGYILVVRRIGAELHGSFSVIKQSPRHITLIAFFVVTGAVLFTKILRKEKNLLRGGMPSGHSALAFSVWVAVSLVTENLLVSFLVLILAAMIAKSRLVEGVHTFWEVFAGSVLGTIITILTFQILW